MGNNKFIADAKANSSQMGASVHETSDWCVTCQGYRPGVRATLGSYLTRSEAEHRAKVLREGRLAAFTDVRAEQMHFM